MSKHVVILAGGKGERLRPFTEDRPKCMIPVLGNPLLSFQLRWLAASGFNKITMCCGYRHEVIRDYFGNGSKFNVNIEYLIENEPLGRGGAMRYALQHIGAPAGSSVLVINGDLLTNLPLPEFENFHKANGGIATLAAVPLTSPYGIVELGEDGIGVKGFTEKPELPFWINAGIYLVDPAIVDLLPEKGDHEVATFPGLAREGRLKAFKTRAFWRTVDTVKDLSEVRSEIEQVLFQAFFQPVSV
ncbi:MAG TPA: nucleotidyltransferase family protein [Candidatus Obscuribacterales bacterium]